MCVCARVCVHTSVSTVICQQGSPQEAENVLQPLMMADNGQKGWKEDIGEEGRERRGVTKRRGQRREEDVTVKEEEDTGEEKVEWGGEEG